MLRFLNHTAASPAHDIALEEALQLSIEEGASPDTWRLWSAREPAAILGTGQEAAKEINLDQARSEKIAVLRRHSGGGTVVIGPGTINFSAFYRFENLPGSQTIRGAMEAALAPVIETLKAWKLNAQFAGLSDIALLCADGTLRKIAGNSQARKRHSVVVHGTLLADPDLERLARLLKAPSSMPEYRSGRAHRDFLTSLKENGAPFSFDEFTNQLARMLGGITVESSSPTLGELTRAGQLLQEKYLQDEWNFRR